jgi:hypothetical protein
VFSVERKLSTAGRQEEIKKHIDCLHKELLPKICLLKEYYPAEGRIINRKVIGLYIAFSKELKTISATMLT